jgi:hypothetical protein
MASGRWRIASGLLVVPAVVGGLAGCSGGGQSATTSASASTASSNTFSAAKLQKALLTQVNGVAAAAPATNGKYSAVSQSSTDKSGTSATQVTPKACSQAATQGFDPTALAGAPAAGVTFQVGTNAVSEVLIASSAKSASSALSGKVPAECAKYQETIGGKTYTYGTSEKAVSGIGTQAKALNVHGVGSSADNLWSLIYQGTGFVGTVTVVGPNASEQAVQQLGQQAYAFAVKSLS